MKKQKKINTDAPRGRLAKTTNKRLLMTGNEALAEGAIRAGCRFYFGYPITPQNEIPAYMAKHLPEHGGVFIQAESELAAINMVLGVAATGGRAMTSSSSPGISLKQEGISYLAGCQLPAVIANIQRGGPGLGSIDPAQGDYFQATRGGGHGDYRTIVLAPISVQEMHSFAIEAFRLADKYRIPVVILADGRLGQMMEPIYLYRGSPPPMPAKHWALTGAKGRKPNCIRSLLVNEGELERHNYKLQKCYREIAQRETRYEEMHTNNCDLLVVAWGTCARVAKGAVLAARARGWKVGLYRPITLWPFPARRLAEITRKTKAVLVTEMNCGQMLEDVRIATGNTAKIFFSGYPGGRVPGESDLLRVIYRITRKIKI
ncbi:MAG: 3-methyl-2-oxobutanoate dehydrogenase subunit VorB [Kiritimatiellia bacterium]|nr:3-methyl-2-oxobutanoate dehydrogenase subunit VorB [Kiritimatiellia bacterium]